VPDDATNRFGCRVRQLRKALGHSQSRFADELGVTLLTVHRWETGKAVPHRASLRRLAELEERVAAAAAPARSVDLGPPPFDFAGDPDAISAFAEALCLSHGHEFNPAFAIETARIDPLPHQRIAVYERMLAQDPLRFLLADDAGAGKTIMTGLLVRELLSRERVRRVLIVPPAGLVGNWERELRTLFRLRFGIYDRRPDGAANPFLGSGGDRLIVSVDTLRGDGAFAALSDPEALPYDLVVLDEAHKLSVQQDKDGVDKTKRYRLAEALAGCAAPGSRFGGLGWSARHLLLLTATPHMGRDLPYHYLWRLLDPQAFATGEAVRRLPESVRTRHFLRRTKEEMVAFDGKPLYLPRHCDTLSYDLSAGERDLYDRTTAYLREFYGRVLSNRPAVELALSVFQRRLVSSNWALLRSFERRIGKLRQFVRDLESGETDVEALQRRQSRRKGRDVFETRGADEEAGRNGREENEIAEEELLGALAVVAKEDLEREIGVLEDLRDRARRLHDAGEESKFAQLRQVLDDPAHAGEKWIVFSEHRDTVDSLIRRLEGLGYSGRVASIHGGMDWPEREEQVERFRDAEGARFLIATDAAGEGINLQFCHLMVNYDIPWNPARLEQRMGRIHRYRQQHEVRVVNLTSKDTREGRVLGVLLEKLETIRRDLTSDKVFDVIGRLFENRSLRQHLRGTLTEDGERDAVAAVKAAARIERVREVRASETAVYGAPGDVAARLPEMNAEVERERYLRLLPAHVRRFVEKSAPLLGLEARGDLDGFFSLAPLHPGALDPLLPALDSLPAADRERLSVRRLGDGVPGVWLHPGEPVFDALAGAVRERFERDAARGAIFTDPRAERPYFFHLGLVSVEEEVPPRAPDDSAVSGVLFSARSPNETPKRRMRERRLVGLRQEEDGTLGDEPVERMLLLHGARGAAPGAIPLASRSIAMRVDAAWQAEAVAERLSERWREYARRDAAERRRPLAAGFDLRAAELARRRRTFREKAEPDPEELDALRREQAALGEERTRALRQLADSPERLHPGEARLLAHALVIPAPDSAEVERYDEGVEEMAVRIASEWERDHRGHVQDVSKPAKARAAGLPDWPGFDLFSIRPDGERRSIEVKGRAGKGGIQVEENEWKQAFHLGAGYWLYVVLDCATSRPTLLRIQDPFHCFVASRRLSEAFSIPAAALKQAAEPDGTA
jgi:superfamily II DNA or RNA helicase/DNA-binding XRE family transcriptional regulator